MINYSKGSNFDILQINTNSFSKHYKINCFVLDSAFCDYCLDVFCPLSLNKFLFQLNFQATEAKCEFPEQKYSCTPISIQIVVKTFNL